MATHYKSSARQGRHEVRTEEQRPTRAANRAEAHTQPRAEPRENSPPPASADGAAGQGSIAKEYLALLARVAFIALVTWLLFSQVFMLMRNVGADMFPAVKDGDVLLGFRLQKEFEQDDVVIYLADGEHRVGRVVAREGDVVNINEEGVLTVNGTVQSGEIMYPTYARETVSYPYTVPEGAVFILADYRTRAQDSRDYGALPLDDVEAKVITLLRRRGL